MDARDPDDGSRSRWGFADHVHLDADRDWSQGWQTDVIEITLDFWADKLPGRVSAANGLSAGEFAAFDVTKALTNRQLGFKPRSPRFEEIYEILVGFSFR